AEEDQSGGLRHVEYLAANLSSSELHRVEVEIREPIKDVGEIRCQCRTGISLGQVPYAAECPTASRGEGCAVEVIGIGVVVGRAKEPPADGGIHAGGGPNVNVRCREVVVRVERRLGSRNVDVEDRGRERQLSLRVVEDQ